jgi:hypothetical protein
MYRLHGRTRENNRTAEHFGGGENDNNNCEDKGIDRSLLKYEKAIKQMMEMGQIDKPMNDELAQIILNELEPIILTKNEMERLNTDLRRVYQDKTIG